MLTHLSFKRAATLALALGAVTAAPASAALAPLPPAPAHVTSAPSAPQGVAVPVSGAQLSARLAHAYGEPRSQVITKTSHGFTTGPRIITSRVTADSGFSWGDAGIGAAAGLVLTILGLGGAVVATRRRPPHAAGRQVQPAATL